jgi:predicted nucleotidyltransferase
MDSDSTCHPSATALRRRIHQTDTPHLAMNDFSEIIGYAILQENNLAKYKDISPDLARRIKNLATNYQSASGFIKDCQTRTFTEGRIRRSLFQCVLGLTETDLSMPYLRLLGCTDAAMRKMHRYFAENVPKSKILTRLATDVKALDEHAHSLFDKDIFASDLYRQVWQEKYHVLLPNEYQHLSVVRP